MKKTGIRDNRNYGSIGEFLSDKIKKESKLSVVSAYFTIYAYEKIKGKLNTIDSMRFLFGEPTFIKDGLDPNKTEKKAFRIETDGSVGLSETVEVSRVAKECAEWIKNKAEIRSLVKPNFLHGKLYHITQSNGTEDGIVWSSNFTVSWLGLNENDKGGNVELNLVVNDRRDQEELREWFDSIWNDETLVRDVKSEVLEYLSQAYADHSPEIVYFKTLYHLFEDHLANAKKQEDDMSQQKILLDTEIWKTLFEFQKDGVKAAITKIKEFWGCILADSVGLGKTYSALAIIKFFELKNEKVLVLCPKALRDNWSVYRANDLLNPLIKDRFGFDLLSHTDLSRESGKSGDIDLATINWGNYDLVVIDESHNFRNSSKGGIDKNTGLRRKSRYEKLLEDVVKSGIRSKILLLSATPVNNDLFDLRNQLTFIAGGDDNAFLGNIWIPSLKWVIGQSQKVFGKWVEAREKDPKINSENLIEKLPNDFFALLDALTIARSRKHIQTYYSEARIGKFPERERPVTYEVDHLDSKWELDDYDALHAEISKYRLSLFNPAKYVRSEYSDEFESKYDTNNIKQVDREFYLIGMMRTGFLKRLESSVHSFQLSLERTINKIAKLSERIEKFHTTGTDDTIDVYEPANDIISEEIEDEEFSMGKSIKYHFSNLKTVKLLKDLKADSDQIQTILSVVKRVGPERDEKLIRLKRYIEHKVKNAPLNLDGIPNKKMLVFTAFSDTAEYLFENLQNYAKELGINIALISGSSYKTTFGTPKFREILTNFSPKSKKRSSISSMPQEGEIDLLIATDCISEGQNLQDCDAVVNYDIHWNPVRLIQRFGRIDRIGSRNETVKVVNFWPTKDLNKYINLKNRVEARMAIVDLSSGGWENMLDRNEIEQIETDTLKYRDRQLVRMKDEILDLEDFKEEMTLSDFSLDEFRADISRFVAEKNEILEHMPMGVFAVVPENPTEGIGAGTIFCLRKKVSEGLEWVNPLSPYFLVYVSSKDSAIRMGFGSSKKILTTLRNLAYGKTETYFELCRAFDRQTYDGKDMSSIVERINVAISDITKKLPRKITQEKGFILPIAKALKSELNEYEIITWFEISPQNKNS